MRLHVLPDAERLAGAAADLLRARLRARPELTMAVPAGRTPRRMYARLRELQASDPVDCARMRIFSIDELCPPAPADGYFWRQVRAEFLAWAGLPADRCHPFRVDAADLAAMCRDHEAAIGAAGGLDLVMLGLGPNAHLASNEPGTAFDSATRPVPLLPETVAYILTDTPNLALAGGAVSGHAVTLGLATIAAAREVVVLVSGEGKRAALRALLEAPVGPDVPATVLRSHAACTVLADLAACGDWGPRNGPPCPPALGAPRVSRGAPR
jgi:glucosamine-6-phosphate deaminase